MNVRMLLSSDMDCSVSMLDENKVIGLIPLRLQIFNHVDDNLFSIGKQLCNDLFFGSPDGSMVAIDSVLFMLYGFAAIASIAPTIGVACFGSVL